MVGLAGVEGRRSHVARDRGWRCVPVPRTVPSQHVVRGAHVVGLAGVEGRDSADVHERHADVGVAAGRRQVGHRVVPDHVLLLPQVRGGAHLRAAGPPRQVPHGSAVLPPVCHRAPTRIPELCTAGCRSMHICTRQHDEVQFLARKN